MRQYTGLEVAVIGMSGKFPGANNIHSFWENLKNGLESIEFFTDDELSKDGEDTAILKNANYVKANAYLKDKESFDAPFFGYIPTEAQLMDPQVRIFHECVWEAIEEAGCDLSRYKGKVGLFAGSSLNLNWEVYAQLINREGLIDSYSATQLSNSRFLATKIAYFLNLRGPVLHIDTACSTSLVAIHQACKSLLLSECHIAIAGGVSIGNKSQRGYLYQEGMINSRDGHCRPFDSSASGTVGGEGVAIVVLKTLKNALHDGDHIWAIIKGSGVNNDGNDKVGYTAPSVNGQIEAIITAQKWARVEPQSISYVEAHGTATRLGDPIEVEALNMAFGSSPEKYCALGSVKSNIGHLDAAAGAAGFIKTVLSLKHKQLPPSLHYKTPNPAINFKDSPFYVNTELKDWQNDKYPLRAGVSSFGIGGTNAHIILEEAPESVASSPSRPSQLLLVSAKTPGALQRNLQNLHDYFENNQNVSLADVAYTLQMGRTAFAYRQSVVCTSREEAMAQLLVAAGQKVVPTSEKGIDKVVFMFSGQGSQYLHMGQNLYKQEKTFREEVDLCLEIVERHSGKDLKAVLLGEGERDKSYLLDNTEYTQPLLFIVEYALARVLQQWGINPNAMIGHSIGEYVAACLSGVFSLDDALALVVKRGELMQKAPVGKMLSVAISESELLPQLAQYPGISLAAINHAEQCIVAGEEEAIHSFKAVMEERGYASKMIRTSHAFHSSMMESAAAEFAKEVTRVTINSPQIPYVSNLSGEWVTYEEISQPQYWANHLRYTVQFQAGIETLLLNKNVVFLEVGPGKALANAVRFNPLRTNEQPVVNLMPSVQYNGGDMHFLLTGIGELWSYGLTMNWESFYAKETRNKVSLPAYAFDKTKFPVNVNAHRMLMGMTVGRQVVKHADVSQWLYTPTWKLSTPTTHAVSVTATCTLFFADDIGLSDNLLKKYEESQQQIVCVKMGASFYEESPVCYQIDPNQESDFAELFARLDRYNLLPDRIIHGWGVSHMTGEEVTDTSLGVYFFSLLKAIKSWMAHDGLANKSVLLLTNDLHPVINKKTVAASKSLAPALMKVLAQEYPSLRTGHVDVSLCEAGFDDLQTDLFTELQNQQTGKVVTLRNGCRWEQHFDKVNIGQSGIGPTLRKDGVYLITGGLGAFGFTIAKYLLKTIDAKVVLLGRTPLPPRDSWEHYLLSNSEEDGMKEKIRRMQALVVDGSVIYLTCNVADAQGMANVMQQAEETFGTINGVIHAAGTITGSLKKPINEQMSADFEIQFESKVKGLQVLQELLGNKDLDFCLITSSLASILGGIGFGAYASANAFMDYYIQAYRGKGKLQRWISVNFDGLDITGKATALIQAEELPEVLRRILTLSHMPQVVVSTSDLQPRLEKWVYRTTIDPISNFDINIETSEETTVHSDDTLSATEKIVLMLWQNFLGRPSIRLDDNFFTIGGDSLKALTLIGRIQKAIHIDIPVAEFFNRPSVRELCNYIDSLQKDGGAEARFTSIPRAPKREQYPLSSAQKRLYFLNAFNWTSLAYNLPQVVKLEGQLDRERLNQAFSKLLERHEILRTFFPLDDDKPVQEVAETVSFKVDFFETAQDSVQPIIQAFIRPFDLARPPLLRVGVISTSAQEHVLMVDIHHIVSDGVSQSVMIQDFMVLYNHHALPPLQLQYKDYAFWQQEALQQAEISRQKDFWTNEFADEVTTLDLPTDFPRPSVKTYEGSSIDFYFDAEQTSRLKAVAVAEESTLYMVLFSIYTVLMGKLANQEDVVIGTPVAGRRHADLETVMGMFVNTLPIRNRLSGHLSFSEFLALVKEKTLACFENQDFQYEELIDHLKLERNISRNPLFDVMFVFQNFEVTELQIPGLILKPYKFESNRSQFDLTLTVVETSGKLLLKLDYATALFTRDTIKRFVQYFEKIAVQIIAGSSQKIADLELLSNQEIRQQLVSFNDTSLALPAAQTVITLFDRQVKKSPNNIALRCGDRTVTYRELQAQSNGIAAYLQAKYALKAGDAVGVRMQKSENLIIILLGILKAGAGYLPIDPHAPQDRVDFILADSAVKVLVTDQAVPAEPPCPVLIYEELTAGINLAAKWVAATPGTGKDLFYIIYTSGSTGRPKGTAIRNESFVNLVNWYGRILDITEKDTFLLIAPVSFDLAQKNIFTPLLHGACLTLSEELQGNYDLIANVIAEHGVTVINCAPAAFYPLLNERADTQFGQLSRLRKVVLGGENINLASFRNWINSGYFNAEVINSYGPTECTDVVSYYTATISDLLESSSLPIGKPVDNTQLYVLDDKGRLQPVGVKGEICIAGIGVSSGYLNNEQLTQQKFIANPYAVDGSLYRTGDIGVWRHDGNIAFLGRADHQVKIRGFRIELGEIESHLLEHEQIKEAIILVKEKEEDKYLVAYYAATNDPGPVALREYLLAHLPDYMVPTFYMHMERLPHTPHGKLDRRALPEPRLIKETGTTVPVNDTEEKLLGIWAEVLNLDREVIGLEQSFFELGGHSLKAMILVFKIQKEVGVVVQLTEVFTHKSIRGLSKFIRSSNNFIALTTDNLEEEKLTKIWIEVLGLEREQINLDKSFFELGGHSLKAMVLTHKILKELDVDIPLTEVFALKNIRGMSSYIRAAKKSEYLSIEKAVDKEYYPLPLTQKRLHFLHEFDSASLVYNQPRFLQLKGGNLSREKVSAVFNHLVARHEIFRTSFDMVDGEPVQRIAPQLNFKVEYFRVGEDKVRGIMQQFIRPFDLKTAPLIRVGHIEVGPGEHFLMVDTHHIIMDGTSDTMFTREFAALYNEEELPEVKLQYKDYVEWLHSDAYQEKLAKHKPFWDKEFASGAPILELPTDFPRPSVKSHQGRATDFNLSIWETSQLRALAEAEGATMFMVLLAAYNILLAKLSNQEDIVVGTPMAGRDHADLENVLGMFVFSHPLRNYPRAELSYKEFLEQVKLKTLSCFDNQAYQFEAPKHESGTDRDTSHNPLFDVLFIHQNFEEAKTRVSGLNFSLRTRECDESKFDLTLTATERNDQLYFSFEYCTRLFKKETVERFIGYFKNILSHITADVNTRIADIELVTGIERHQIIHQFNTGMMTPRNNATVVDLFEAQVMNNGAAKAVSCQEAYLSYKELNQKANQLSHYLTRKHGVGPEDVIALHVPRSIDMVISLLAVLKSGAAYLPLDANYPVTRINSMLQDARVKCVLSTISDDPLLDLPFECIHLEEKADLISACPDTNPSHKANPVDLAYILYTSGSTGKPKGIQIEHASMVDYVLTFQEYYSVTAADRVIQQASLTFDTAVEEIFPAIISGAQVIIMPESGMDIDYMVQAVQTEGATILTASPLVLNELNQYAGALGSLRALISGGDVLLPEHISNLLAVCPVYNTYGPTESTVCITYHEVGKLEETGLIGKPIRNRQVLILNKQGGLCPISVQGEICVSGIGLARGYLNNSALTHKKFVDNPFCPGQRMYRTGDTGRWLDDGRIEFTGRLDDQVKIRGIRIEPGEIESQLLSHGAVRSAIVVARQKAGNKYLVAYYVSEQEVAPGLLRSFLLEKLPDYMVPAYYVYLERLPITVSGKLDRKALPEPENVVGNHFVSPTSATEKKLVCIWAKLFRLEEGVISVDSNFFELGGHSLNALSLSNQVYMELNVKVPIKEFFARPTIELMARYIEANLWVNNTQEVHNNEIII